MGATSQMRKQIQKKNPTEPAEPENTTGLAVQMADPEQSSKVPEEKRRQVEDLTALFVQLIHSKKTSGSVMEMLSAFPTGDKAIPPAANTLLGQVEGRMAQRKQKVPNDVKIAAISYVVSDLALLGNKAGVWEQPVGQDQIQPILQESMQLYIRKGLKNKTLDPIQLQKEAEQLLTPEQRERGLSFGQEGGTPGEPTANMAARQYADQQVAGEQGKYAKLQEENAQLKAALQGGAEEEAGEIPAEQENQGALQGM